MRITHRFPDTILVTLQSSLRTLPTVKRQQHSFFYEIPVELMFFETFLASAAARRRYSKGVRPTDVAGGSRHPVSHPQPFGDDGAPVRGQDLREREGGPQGVFTKGPRAGVQGDRGMGQTEKRATTEQEGGGGFLVDGGETGGGGWGVGGSRAYWIVWSNVAAIRFHPCA